MARTIHWIVFVALLGGFACAEEDNPADNPTRAFYEPARLAEDFFAVPFPDDSRLTEEGLVDLTLLPNRSSNLLLQIFLPQVESRFRGFGTSGAIYFYFSGPLDESTLPQSPTDTLMESASAFLVNVDPESPFQGERVPLLVRFQSEPTKFTPENTLVLLPFPGFPLRSASRYAAVLTQDIRDADGLRIGSSKAFLRDAGPNLTIPLPGGGILSKSNLAAAAVFTTQDVVGPLLTGAEVVTTSARIDLLKVERSERRKAEQCFDLYEGKFESPNFLSGPPPYLSQGTGIFVLDAEGTPQVQDQETLSFVLSTPPTPPPSGGFPIAIYMHGTGGSRFSFVGEDLACLFAEIGVAAIGIDQPLHGARNPSDTEPILLTVNLTNVNSSLDLLRQAAFDTLATSILIRKASISAETSKRGQAITFDPNHILFMGHSQGTTTGVPYLMIDPDVKAAMLSGSGGNMIYFVKDRLFKGDDEIADLLGTTPEEAAEQLKQWFGVKDDPVDEFHFLLTLFQTVTEGIDPVNYAPYVIIDTLHPKHIFMTEGFEDAFLPPSTNEALAAALGVDMLSPLKKEVPFLDIFSRSPLDPPISLNMTTPSGSRITGGDQQYESGDHWVALNDPRAIAQVREFFRSSIASGAPVIPPGP